MTRHRALRAYGAETAVTYRDGRQGVLSGRGRWGQVEVTLDDGTRMWWQDKDVRAVGSSASERAAGDGSDAADAAADATIAGGDDDERAG